MTATYTLLVEATNPVDRTLTLKVWATPAASILDTAFTRGFVLGSLMGGPSGTRKAEYDARKSVTASWAKTRYRNALADLEFPTLFYDDDPEKAGEKEAFLDRYCTHVEVLRIVNHSNYSSEVEDAMWARVKALHAANQDIFAAYQHYFLHAHMTDEAWATAYQVGDVIESSSFEVFPEDSKNPYRGASRLANVSITRFQL
ncbi:hypothetical protein ACNOYE_33845 [Nannocystaceae bacterium ST9]